MNMAFGKDKSRLGAVGSFRQQATMTTRQRATRPKNTGGGTRPNWIDKYEPSLIDVDIIRLMAGDYETPILVGEGNNLSVVEQPSFGFSYCQHYDARHKKFAQCSAGPYRQIKNRREPCIGCDVYWREAGKDPVTGKWKYGYMGNAREMISFSVIHHAPYAKIEQTDRQTGQVRCNDKGEPYYEWVQVLPHERAKYAGKEMKTSHMLHWSMGTAHWNTLMSAWKQVEKCCRSCGGRDTIISDAWFCTNCHNDVIDAQTTTIAPKDLEQLTTNPFQCPHCHTDVVLMERVDCSNCDPSKPHIFDINLADGEVPRPQAPERATIFDVNLKVQRIAASDGSKNNSLSVSGFSDPHPLAQELAALKQMPLDRLFAPTPLDKQAELFQEPMPAKKLPPGTAPAQQTQVTPPRQPVTSATSFARPYAPPPPATGGTEGGGGGVGY
jgi:hypothetical protein